MTGLSLPIREVKQRSTMLESSSERFSGWPGFERSVCWLKMPEHWGLNHCDPNLNDTVLRGQRYPMESAKLLMSNAIDTSDSHRTCSLMIAIILRPACSCDQFMKDFSLFSWTDQSLVESLIRETEAVRIDADLI